MGNDFGQVGRREIGVGGGDQCEQPQRLFLDGGFGVGGGVVEAIEEHRKAVGGEGLDYFLEIFDGDLVSVSVGEFGERGEDSLLEFHHG